MGVFRNMMAKGLGLMVAPDGKHTNAAKIKIGFFTLIATKLILVINMHTTKKS